jgi:uncharacterized protein (DUF58 family)
MLRNRIIFGILWVLSIVGISFYGGPVSYGIFLVLTSVPLISLIYLLYVFFTYRIYQEIGSKDLVANTAVPYFITLQNERRVLFSNIRVQFYTTFSEIAGIDPDREYELSPRSGIKLETNLICRYRGEYEVGIKRITLTDFFDLIRFSFAFPEPLRVKVKPDYETDMIPSDEEDFLSYHEHLRKAEYPDVITGDYVPGDEIKRINWKQTAKTGKLKVRKLTGEERNGILLIPDTCRHSSDEYEYIPSESRILNSLLSLSLYYLKKGIPVSLLALQKTGTVTASADSEQEFEKFYECVSKLDFDDMLGLEKLKGMISSGEVIFSEDTVVYISDKEKHEAEN